MSKGRSEADRRARQGQRIGRALRLLCLIQERHGRWDLAAIARELGCSTKTVQRDLLALEAAHIPFYFDKQRCCYKVRPGFRLSILEDRSGQPHETANDVNLEGKGHPTTPAEYAELSREHAERLLIEAERLVEALDRLCRSLRRSGYSPDTNGPGSG
jgi:hypothetical protein